MVRRQTVPGYFIALPLTRACIEKWNQGRENHGPDFVGEPIPEAFEECLDGINYLDQAEMKGTFDERLTTAKNHLMLAAERIREYWLNPEPTPEQKRSATVRTVRKQAAYELRNDLLEDEVGQAWSAIDALLKATADGATPEDLAQARQYAAMVQEDCSGPAEEPEVFNG
jgi:hypothetical protein